MKKILLFSWTTTLLVILFFCIKSFFQKEDQDLIYQKNEVPQSIFTPIAFNALASQDKYILLTITSAGCDMCELVRNNPILEEFPLTPYFIEREICPNNMLVSQVLPAHGFPASYVFNDQQEIIGYIHGAANLEENLNTILLKKDEIQTDTLLMLTNSFKSFMAYLNNDQQNMFYYAQESLNYKSYFFNNYLLYTYYRKQQNDSCEFYKNQALESLEGSDIFVYESLVKELAPNHPMLEWIPEATHVHDENCAHEHSKNESHPI